VGGERACRIRKPNPVNRSRALGCEFFEGVVMKREFGAWRASRFDLPEKLFRSSGRFGILEAQVFHSALNDDRGFSGWRDAQGLKRNVLRFVEHKCAAEVRCRRAQRDVFKRDALGVAKSLFASQVHRPAAGCCSIFSLFPSLIFKRFLRCFFAIIQPCSLPAVLRQPRASTRSHAQNKQRASWRQCGRRAFGGRLKAHRRLKAH